MIALEAAGYVLFGALVLWLVWYWSSVPEDLGSVSNETRRRL